MADLTEFIVSHLKTAPKPWLRIRGTQGPDSPPPKPPIAVDFDLKIDCSQVSMLSEAELENVPGEGERRVKIDISHCENNGEAVEMVEREVCRIASGEAEWRGLSIYKLVTNYSLPRLTSSIHALAAEILYNGNLEVTLHDYFVPEIANIGDADHGAILEVGWAFEWPSLMNASEGKGKKKEIEWRNGIMSAMVEKEQGWVTLDRSVPDGVLVFGGEKGGTRKVGIDSVLRV